MTEECWQLMCGDRLAGTLRMEAIDMFWTDCTFEPGPEWEVLRPLFDASRDAWVRGDREAAMVADHRIRAAGLVLAGSEGGATITDFLIRIHGGKARFRW
ncbi:hypothetical protein GCM10010269_53770 [Streptomyces humidus]|uniref:Uncharacterized protein n=1 Tax=Streptomyces humidus TaxID=52259 RepID=A0A918FZK4_9ACTN|nr:hypothetical protein [Streptomyces humidus]GGS07922.1 hypothetical protein GCM10010269_53770 [Streptomyces humidus]